MLGSSYQSMLSPKKTPLQLPLIIVMFLGLHQCLLLLITCFTCVFLLPSISRQNSTHVSLWAFIWLCWGHCCQVREAKSSHELQRAWGNTSVRSKWKRGEFFTNVLLADSNACGFSVIKGHFSGFKMKQNILLTRGDTGNRKELQMGGNLASW